MKIKSIFKNNQAFTLIELLVVIAIIGILATLSLLGYRVVRARAYDVQKKADLRSLSIDLMSYSLDHSDKFPASRHTGLVAEPLTNTSYTGGTLITGSYRTTIPQDPDFKESYRYLTHENIKNTDNKYYGKSYILQATLSAERGKVYQLSGGGDTDSPTNQTVDLSASINTIGDTKDTPPVWVSSPYYIMAEKITDTSVKVHWGKATDIVPPVSYKVYYGQAKKKSSKSYKPDYFPSPSITPLTSKLQYTITDLTPNLDFSYQIAAVDIIGQETLTEIYQFTWVSTDPPYWRTNAKFTICTKAQCDPGGLAYYSTITEDNKVGVYVSGACGYKTGPGAIIDCVNSDGAILEYKESSDTVWEEISFNPIAFPVWDGGRLFYLPSGTYDFKVRIFNAGGSVYYPDPNNPSQPLIKTGYVVPGKPDGQDLEPPLMKTPPGFSFIDLGSDGKQCPKGTYETCNKVATKGILKWTAAEDNVALDHYEITINGSWKHIPVDPVTRKYIWADATYGSVKLTRTSIYNSIILPISFRNDNLTAYQIKLTAYDINDNSSTYTDNGSGCWFSEVFTSDP